MSFEEYLKASGISEHLFYKIVAEIRKEIGVKSKHDPLYISKL